jgi:hypothetical protein
MTPRNLTSSSFLIEIESEASAGSVASYRHVAASTSAAPTTMSAKVAGRGLNAKDTALSRLAAAIAAAGSAPDNAAAAIPTSQAKARKASITGKL